MKRFVAVLVCGGSARELPVVNHFSHAVASTPVVVQAPPQPVAALHVKHEIHESNTVVSKGTSEIEARDATQFLMAQNVGKELPEFRFFKPRCVEHMRRVLRRIDLSYTDEQLRTVLEHECMLENDFPTTREDGFEHNRACKAYADDLSAARDEELSTGKTNGYDVFCKNYYVHKGGKLEQPTGETKAYAVTPVRKEFMKELKKEATEAEREGDKVEQEVDASLGPKTKEHQPSWIPIIMIALLVLVCVALIVLKKSKTQTPS